MLKGKIFELHNNYGMIVANTSKADLEEIPFEIEQNMLEKKEGKEYIKYTDEVEFTLSQNQGMRDRDIKEVTNIKFIGDEWKYQERNFETGFCQIVRNRLDKYNFYYPNLDDKNFSAWLENNDFYPRMMEYLSNGIFIPKELLWITVGNNIDLECADAKFKIELLSIIDRIDIEFRKNIMSWIIGIENGYKTYFTKISISEDGHDIGANVISVWAASKPKTVKMIRRARNKRKYRSSSDEFDYLTNADAVPLQDFMEQMDLKELSELVNGFYDAYSKEKYIPKTLIKMKECIGFISDLCVLRNAAAHGRSLLPVFMDPDYNGNWDLEFDNVDERCNVEKWILYDLLKKKWEDNGLGEYKKEIVNTLYGNPLRRAWIELNYIYFYIIAEIEKKSFDIFKSEANWFLSADDDLHRQLRNVDMHNLRLSDMGMTTFGISPAPFSEIANEAFSVWELFAR